MIERTCSTRTALIRVPKKQVRFVSGSILASRCQQLHGLERGSILSHSI